MKKGQKNKPSSAVEERRFSAASTSQSVNRASAPDKLSSRAQQTDSPFESVCEVEEPLPARTPTSFARHFHHLPPFPPAGQGSERQRGPTAEKTSFPGAVKPLKKKQRFTAWGRHS